MSFKTSSQALTDMAFKVRQHIINLSTDGGCFIGASLSCADLLVYLYEEYLDIVDFDDPNRDYLLLSKGHDVPALYGVFVEKGWLDKDRLKNHLKSNDDIYWHPNRKIPGVEFHSGSLGHLPSVSLGLAYDIKASKGNNRVVCILGDGECNEGSVWETFLVASAKKIDNLVFVIDRNHFQANMATEDLIPLEPMQDKFSAFGLETYRIDGHDFEALHKVFSSLDYTNGKPKCIIADTVRGKGLPSIEARADRWFCNFKPEEIESLHLELQGKGKTNLISETLTVR
ncbi:MAG: thiamine pyrophosphate-dependent enzyme [Chitinophagales bacterium]|jgi:transketolase|nr:thiamine pyrophosphate-dependent enzyme [Chitinophagales bacterium]